MGDCTNDPDLKPPNTKTETNSELNKSKVTSINALGDLGVVTMLDCLAFGYNPQKQTKLPIYRKTNYFLDGGQPPQPENLNINTSPMKDSNCKTDSIKNLNNESFACNDIHIDDYLHELDELKFEINREDTSALSFCAKGGEYVLSCPINTRKTSEKKSRKPHDPNNRYSHGNWNFTNNSNKSCGVEGTEEQTTCTFKKKKSSEYLSQSMAIVNTLNLDGPETNNVGVSGDKDDQKKQFSHHKKRSSTPVPPLNPSLLVNIKKNYLGCSNIWGGDHIIEKSIENQHTNNISENENNQAQEGNVYGTLYFDVNDSKANPYRFKKYKGEYKSNQRPNGFGKMIFSNGDVYDGKWKTGKKFGFGVYKFGLIKNKFTPKDCQYEKMEGEFDDQNFKGKIWFKNGDVKDVRIVDEIKTPKFITYESEGGDKSLKQIEEFKGKIAYDQEFDFGKEEPDVGEFQEKERYGRDILPTFGDEENRRSVLEKSDLLEVDKVENAIKKAGGQENRESLKRLFQSKIDNKKLSDRKMLNSDHGYCRADKCVVF